MTELQVSRTYPFLDQRVIRELSTCAVGEVYPGRRRYYSQRLYLKRIVDSVIQALSKLPQTEDPFTALIRPEEEALVHFVSELRTKSAMMEAVRPFDIRLR